MKPLYMSSVGTKVLLKNNRRADRKGGKEELLWTGPYTVVASAKDGNAYQIRNEKGAVLRRKYHRGQL